MPYNPELPYGMHDAPEPLACMSCIPYNPELNLRDALPISEAGPRLPNIAELHLHDAVLG